jgi:hypothetical protein
MSGHTPTPWTIGGELIIGDNGKIVARVSYAHHGPEHVQDFKESEANARLMASAPTPIPDFLIIDAVRYCMGRQTYAVSEITDWLQENWTNIPRAART